VNLPAGVDGGW